MRYHRSTGWVMKIVTAACVLTIFLSSVFAAEKPETFVQLGHSEVINSIALSPDGKYLLSGSNDKTLKLWEVSTGREIRTLIGHTQEVMSVAFSPDGKHAVSSDDHSTSMDNENNILLWNIEKGVVVKKIPIRRKEGKEWERGYTPSVVFSPDGRHIAAGVSISNENFIIIYDLETGRSVKEFSGGPEHFPTYIAFSPDGNYLVSGSGGLFADISKDNAVRLWDVKTGKEIKRFIGHTKGIMSVAFSPDGGYLASGSRDETVILWNIKSGKKERIFNNHGPYASIAFSPDGKYLVSAAFSDIKLWNVTTGQNIFTHQKEYKKFNPTSTYSRKFKSTAFSPDGGYIAAGYHDVTGVGITLLDAASGVEVRKFGGDAKSVCFVYFSADGRKIHTAFLSGAAGRQSAASTVDLINVTMNSEENTGCSYGDGRFLSKEVGKDFIIIDSKTGKEIMRVDRSSDAYRDIYSYHAKSFSPDAKYALIDTYEKDVKVFDIEKGKNIATLELGSIKSNPRFYEYKWVFSPDGRYVVAAGSLDYGDDALKLWDVFTGRLLKTFDIGHFPVTVSYTPDGKYILSGSSRGTMTLWDVQTGKEVRTFTGHSDRVRTITISPDGKYALSGSWDGTMKLWDLATGKGLQTFRGHTNWVESVAFSPDGRYAVSASRDGTTRLWDTNTGKEIAQFINFTDGEWIVITPEGYFNASPGGAKHLNVRVGNHVYSIDNFYEKFFNPVYVASVLQGKKVEAVADIRKGILSPPDVRITSPAPGKEFSTDTLTVMVSAKDTGGGIDEIRLYHNGKAIGDDTRAVKIVSRGREAIREYTVSLVDGVNTFRAVGFSKDRTESNPYELVVQLTAPSKDVSLYVFAVGINKYKNPALNLNYAEPDARGIADFFKQQGKRLFKNVDIKVIYNEQATKENIVSKLSQLQNINPQDAVLIYLAGHGDNINEKWYFIPHELTYPEREEDVKTKGISSDELSGYMKNIKAQKILVLIDACKSGAVLVAFRGFEDRKALSQLSRSTGVHIIAASTKDQFAAEVKDLGHGVFTYTLLEGLKGKAAGGGETVTVFKLKAYLDEQLPEITKKYKQEAQYPVGDTRGMDFPLVIVK